MALLVLATVASRITRPRRAMAVVFVALSLQCCVLLWLPQFPVRPWRGATRLQRLGRERELEYDHAGNRVLGGRQPSFHTAPFREPLGIMCDAARNSAKRVAISRQVSVKA